VRVGVAPDHAHALTLFLERLQMPTNDIAKQTSLTFPPLTNTAKAAGIVFYTVDGFIYYDDNGAARTIVNEEEAQTISGDKTFSGSTAFTGATTIAGLGLVQVATTALTNAQVLALRAAPITVVAAPGAGFFVELLGGHITFDYTAAYTETDDDVAFKYTNGSGAACSETIPGEFLEATADAAHTIVPITALAVANAPIVIHNTGAEEFGGGNAANVVTVTVRYRVNPIP
jgi:hypothetical protein